MSTKNPRKSLIHKGFRGFFLCLYKICLPNVYQLNFLIPFQADIFYFLVEYATICEM